MQPVKISLKVILFLFLLIILSSCYFTWGEVDEIEIPIWLQGDWNVKEPNGEEAGYFNCWITEEFILFISRNGDQFDLIDDVVNTSGYDEATEDRYLLNYYIDNIFTTSEFEKRNGNHVFFYLDNSNRNSYYILERT